MGTFGDKFRQERERKQISLEDVSRSTKISPRMLQAIEDEHFNVLPGGVFNKGFIRAYAKHLGLDDEETVSEYLACLRQSQIDASAALEPAPAASVAVKTKSAVAEKYTPHDEDLPNLHLPRAQDLLGRRPPSYPRENIPWKVPVAVVILVVAAGIFWNRRSHVAPAQPPTPLPATASTASSDPVAVTVPAVPPKSSAAGSPQPTAAPQHPAVLQVQPAAANVNGPAVLAAKQSPLPDDDDDVTPRPAHAPILAKAAASPPKLILVIRAAETSWISITADGQPVGHETLIAPAHTSVRATREIVVKAGNAAGVTFLWNGKEIPAQGGESEVKTLVFDAQGMHVVPPTPSPEQTR